MNAAPAEPKPPADPKQAYRVVALPPDLVRPVLASWRTAGRLERDNPAIDLSGPCPWCEHKTPWTWSQRKMTALTATDGEGVTWFKERETIHCRCVGVHSELPEKVYVGCGRVWNLDFDWYRTATTVEVKVVDAGPAPSAPEVGFEEEWAELKKAELEQARTQADSWAKIMAGLAGLAGATQLFEGPELAKGLADWAQDAVGVLLVAVVVLAALSAVLAGIAAHGWPDLVKLENTREAGGSPARALAATREKLVSRTGCFLKLAAYATATAALAAVLVGAVIWFGPKAKSETGKTCIDTGAGIVQVDAVPKVESGALTLVACP